MFKIDNVTLYSSATASPNVENYGNIDIWQFTDISFNIQNINNRKISEFTISDIDFSTPAYLGEAYLNYKNPLEFGKQTSFDKAKEDTINFEVLNSDTDIDYSKPYVLNNLSNPITLEYSNLVKPNYSIPTKTSLLFYDGRMLKETNIDIADISCSYSFRVSIVTIEGEIYTYKVIIPSSFKEENASIYDGSLLQTINLSGYSFYRTK